MTASNLLNDGCRLVMIDPSVKPFMWHWMLDAAKYRASLNGLDAVLKKLHINPMKPWVAYFDSQFSEAEMRTIKILEKSHYVRVAYYANKLGEPEIAEKLKQMYYGE